MDWEILRKSELFRGFTAEDIERGLSCLDYRTSAFRKGEVIYWNGTVVSSLGVVLEGQVQIETNDVWGNRSIMGVAGVGDTFAETYACLDDMPIPMDVIATEKTKVLFINVNCLFHSTVDSNGCHESLMRNILTICAKKNIRLTERISDTAPKTIRERILSYLSRELSRTDGKKLVIPYDRQQLADYLNVDRSALSNELGKMKREGLIDFRKNVFELFF